MKLAAALLPALGLALFVAGCSTGGGESATVAAKPAASATGANASGETADVAGSKMKDFSLQVKCPGIHLEKTRFGWSDEKITGYEKVTADQIAQCEAWEAVQPKGYVPSPGYVLEHPSSAAASPGATAQ